MLAWNRVSTAGNLTYKRYFRPVFYAYEFASVQNIADLHARLNGGSFRPGRSSRLFIPKGAGLNRSITLLHVEDQIVLQALTNILAGKVRDRRQAVEGKVVFSNQLNSEKDSIFFLESWRWCYRRYLDQIESLYARGYKWVAYFDLAAFYDTISHELLLKTVYPNMKASTDGDAVCEWLEKWITPRPTWPLQHGIPQGPQSSDFLAEIFLLPIDEEMSKSRKHAYVRYVDDIRIFGKTELDVQAAVQKLEGVCRDRGLIPQGKKFAVAELKSRKDALGTLPSIPSGSAREPRPLITEQDAVKHFREALGGRPLRVTDKSRLRYVLFRGPPSAKIRTWVLQLMRHHPEHIEAFAAYLRQFRRTRSTLQTCIDLLRFTPSSFVKGELFHLLTPLVTKAEAKRLIPIAKDLAMKKEVGVLAKWGAMVFLCRAEELGLGKLLKIRAHSTRVGSVANHACFAGKRAVRAEKYREVSRTKDSRARPCLRYRGDEASQNIQLTRCRENGATKPSAQRLRRTRHGSRDTLDGRSYGRVATWSLWYREDSGMAGVFWRRVYSCPAAVEAGREAFRCGAVTMAELPKLIQSCRIPSS